MHTDRSDAVRAWTQRPAQPIAYPLSRRIQDRYQGWRDGRKGVPMLPVDNVTDIAEAPTVATPKLEELRRLSRELIENERIGRDVDCAGHAEQCRRLQGKVHSSSEVVDHARGHLDGLTKLGTDDEVQRRSTELGRADRPDDLVRRRRRAEHARRVERAASAYESALRQLDGLLAEIAALDDAIEMRRCVAAARARRIYEHVWRRAAVYWHQLVIAHRNGPQLNAALRPTGPDLPAWAREDTPKAAAAEFADQDKASTE